jgi:hypothetical protein
VRSLAWIATPESLQCLDKYIHQSDLSTTLEIITVLGRVTKPNLKNQAVAILSNFYETQSPKLRHSEILQGLCYSLKQLNAITTINILREIETNNNPQVRFHAQSALKQLLIRG